MSASEIRTTSTPTSIRTSDLDVSDPAAVLDWVIAGWGPSPADLRVLAPSVMWCLERGARSVTIRIEHTKAHLESSQGFPDATHLHAKIALVGWHPRKETKIRWAAR